MLINKLYRMERISIHSISIALFCFFTYTCAKAQLSENYTSLIPEDNIIDSPTEFSKVETFCCKCNFDSKVYEELCLNPNQLTSRKSLLRVIDKTYFDTAIKDVNTTYSTENSFVNSLLASFRFHRWRISWLCCEDNLQWNSSSSGECSVTHKNDDYLSESEQNGTCASVKLDICQKYEINQMSHEDPLMFWLITFSCCLLGLTILTYLLLPSLLNVHGRCILCHLVFLMMFFMLQLAELYVKPDPFLDEFDRLFSPCWILGLAMYVTSIAANLWLLAVNIDLFQTFTRKYVEDVEDGRKRFHYCTAAVMTTTVFMTIAVLTLELTLPMASDWRPQIACTRCFFPLTHGYSILVYYYGIIAAILCFNLIVFSRTNWVLCILQSKISKVKDESTFQQVLGRLLLFFKLFCVSGTAWTINLVLWIINAHEAPHEQKHGAIRFFECINVSHGFCYFIVFVCKPSILKMYRLKFFSHSSSSPSASTHETFSGASTKRLHRV